MFDHKNYEVWVNAFDENMCVNVYDDLIALQII